jgi:hypothetical protein
MRPTKKRATEMQKAEKELMALSTDLQSQYLESVMRAVNSAINTKGNSITTILNSKLFLTAWKRIVGRGVNDFMKEELMKIEEQTTQYYSQYDSELLPFSKIKQIVVNDLKLNISNFATNFNDSEVVANRTRTFALGLIQRDLSSADVRKEMESFVLGNGEKLGVVDNYNMYETRVQDVFAEYDRRLSNAYATQLNLNYFIYQGGEIKTTRDFCEERNGNVYTREEGLAFNSLDWDGKKAGNFFFTDCGGYNCRHFCDWISYELAKQLRPGIPKSTFDTN